MSRSDQLLTLATIRQVELQRVATWMLAQVQEELAALQRQVAAAVMQADATGTPRADFRRTRLAKLLLEIEEASREVFGEMKKRLVGQLNELNAIQVADEKRNWSLVAGLSFTGDVGTTARKTLMFGQPLPDAVDSVRDEFVRRTGALVRQSVANLEATGTTVEKVLGNPKAGGVGPVVKPAANAMERVARSTVAAASNAAAAEVEPPSRLSPMHWVHVSILDSRTSAPCRARAFKRWDQDKKPLGHALPFQQPPIYPPEHPCRSRLVRYFEDDGPPKVVTFKEWLANILTPREQEKVFGAKALALWRKGQLTDSQLIRQDGRPLSIDALRKITQEKGETQKQFPFL